jgi:hypothetical protein
MDCDCDECRRPKYPAWHWWDRKSPGPWSTLMAVLAVLAVVGVFLWGR